MIGIIVNVLSVVVGGVLGTLFGHRLSSDFTEKMTAVSGICAIGMGVFSISLMENMPAVILAVVLGTAVGLILHIGDRLNKSVAQLQKSVSQCFGAENRPDTRSEESALLLTAIVLFCASGTGIYGCLDAGMTGSATILLSKAVLDFFVAMVFACSLGIVTSFIAIPQSVIFVGIFLLAKLIFPLTTPITICDFKACGGFLLIATGLRMAKIKDFPVADMILAMILVMPLSIVWTNYIATIL